MTIFLLAALMGLDSFAVLAGMPVAAVARSRAEIVALFPHDAGAFTQGLLYFDGHLYESTGLHGRSSLRRVNLTSGQVLMHKVVPEEFFGEGLARVGDQLYQLTWKAGVAFVYSLPDLRLVGQQHYHGQGWGLTWNGEHLIMSNGSSTLLFLNRSDFSIVRRLSVTYRGQALGRINELEYFCGAIWANIRYSDTVVRINPATGAVTGRLDATPLRRALSDASNAGVLNGIAWDADKRRLFLTGKNWPWLFQVKLPWPCGSSPTD